ncbi:MAG: glycosyltransferase family 4 protein [Pseudomonadota bacterium]
MRICFLSRRYWPAVSGMSVYAENLLRQLVAMGHDVTMLSQYRDDDAGRGIYGGGPPPEVPGVRVIGMRSHGEERASAGQHADFEGDLRALYDTVLAEHARAPFDVIHAQYAYPTGLAAVEAARRLGLPSVVSIQGGDGHWVGLCCQTHARAMAEVLARAGRLLIGSKSFAEEVAANHAVPLSRFSIVPGATDTDAFTPGTPRSSGPVRLLYHGRIDLRKGLGELIEAAAILAERGIDYRLRVSGIGPDLEAVKTLADRKALGPRCVFTGYVGYREAPEVYRGADIFVSPTYSEGFSNTILEAMAARLAIVSTETIGVVDCLRHDDNALLVPVQDTEALAKAMARLIAEPALATRLADAALEEVRRCYAWPVVARTIVGHYSQDCPDAAPEGVDLPSFAAADPTCRFRTAPHLL